MTSWWLPPLLTVCTCLQMCYNAYNERLCVRVICLVHLLYLNISFATELYCTGRSSFTFSNISAFVHSNVICIACTQAFNTIKCIASSTTQNASGCFVFLPNHWHIKRPRHNTNQNSVWSSSIHSGVVMMYSRLRGKGHPAFIKMSSRLHQNGVHTEKIELDCKGPSIGELGEKLHYRRTLWKVGADQGTFHLVFEKQIMQ